MFEEKESIWKKKGFYVSVCTAMICLLAIGTVYYRMNRSDAEGSLWASQEASSAPKSDIPEDAAGDGINDASGITGGTQSESVNNSFDFSISAATDEEEEEDPAEAKTEKPVEVAGASAAEAANQTKQADTSDSNKKKQQEKKKASDKEEVAETMVKQLSFKEEKGLLWPVSGDVLMKYDMTGVTYFKTLAQYRCNPALIISAKEGTKVKAATDGKILSVKKNDETGTTVTMNIGNDYTLVYGQLKDVKVKAGDLVKEGDVLASIASPSRYYTEEGANLYFQVKEKDDTVDPLLLLR